MALSKTYDVVERPIAALGIVSPPPIQVDFPKFSGSLAQLFACVRDHRVDLLDVPLLPICEAYFHYLLSQEKPDLDESAAALAALSFLLERKAWRLLPLPEKEPEEPESLSLVTRTIHEYFETLQFLRDGYDMREKLFFRSANPHAEEYEVPFSLESLQAISLAEAFQAVLLKARPYEMPNVARSGRMLAAEMGKLFARMSDRWETLEGLMLSDGTREDAVYLFLSVLELIRLGQVRSRQTASAIEFARA